MKLELLLQAIKMSTEQYGSPYDILDNIRIAKEKNIDILVGPEWSLTSPPGIFSKSLLRGKKSEKVVEAMFNAPDYNDYVPRDAEEILLELIEEGVKKFEEVPYIPHSKIEHDKLISEIMRESKEADMLIFPGTDMFYDEKRILYNNMPIIYSGRLIKNLYKARDGLGSRFNLGGKLCLYSVENIEYFGNKPDYSQFFGNNPIIKSYGLNSAVEICADSGLLNSMGVTNLDMQILSSCGNSSTVSVTKDKGYLIAVDGFKEGTVRVNNKYERKMKPIERNKNYEIYKLDFDI